MSLILGVAFFVLGLIIGSFLNVVICRFNTSKTFGGRSVCLSCNEELCWYDLIPLVSFFALKGRCRHCKSRFSWQYPIIEFLTAVIFVLLFSKFELLFWINLWSFIVIYAYYAVMFSILLVVAAYDWRHKIIPDTLSFTFGVLALLGMFFIAGNGITFHIPGMMQILSGILLSAPFAALWFVSRGRWMGLGDAKLILGLGWLLGLELGLSALILAFWAGAVIGVVLLVLSRRYSMRSEIPFAPFLIFSSIAVFFWEIKIISLYLI